MKALSHERPISDHRPQTGRDFATITQAPQAPSMAGGGSRHVGAALNSLVIETPRCCRKTLASPEPPVRDRKSG